MRRYDQDAMQAIAHRLRVGHRRAGDYSRFHSKPWLRR
ncbi:hypothetical protein XHC_0494 [Xanthomonas hortorum pv. carotae str. M081]|nr:hypothetical protein XHC_0494 [Xanthomonas hortorum pv. carotae str. M081]